MAKDELDKNVIIKRTIELYQTISPGLIDAVGEAAKIAEADFSDLPTIASMIGIHSSLLLLVESSRHALTEILGGEPIGKARLKVIEDNFRQTILGQDNTGVADILSERLKELSEN